MKKPTIPDEQVVKALKDAQVPVRYCSKSVSLSSFKWGKRMAEWIDGPLTKQQEAKGYFLTGTPEDGLVACAMLTRSLILRGLDAYLVNMPSLTAETGMLRLPRHRFLVIAGFYDHAFHSKHGIPATVDWRWRMSWAVRDAHANGSTVIAQVNGLPAHSVNWWNESMLLNVFDFSRAFNLTTK